MVLTEEESVYVAIQPIVVLLDILCRIIVLLMVLTAEESVYVPIQPIIAVLIVLTAEESVYVDNTWAQNVFFLNPDRSRGKETGFELETIQLNQKSCNISILSVK